MGCYGLAPADNVAASYYPNIQTLRLEVDGHVVTGAYGFQFRRDPQWVGGLRYFFECWYPMGDIRDVSTQNSVGTEPFKYTQDFIIPNIKLVAPSGNVVIVTENQPDRIVPIRWLGFGPSVDGSTDKSNEAPLVALSSLPAASELKSADATVAVQDFPPLPRIEVLGKPFEIVESAQTGSGYIDFTWDEKALVLQGVKLRRGQIVLTVNSLKAGYTEFVLFGYGGHGAGLWRSVISIDVLEK